MSEPCALVEHFFRHEYGRLVAVLTRSLGLRRLALVEDVVQAALVQALETWSRRGVPEEPVGWLYCIVRNLAIDALRRERNRKWHDASAILFKILRSDPGAPHAMVQSQVTRRKASQG